MIKRLMLLVLLLVPTSSYAGLLSGDITAIPESKGVFSWGDGVNNLHQQWSIAYFNYSGWFYSSEYSESNADVFVYSGLADISLAGDASLFEYQSLGAVHAWEGDTVFFRGTNGFYGAWKIDAIDGFYDPTAIFPYRNFLSGTWYFLEDGKSDFSISKVSEPPMLYLSVLFLFLFYMRRKQA